MLVVFGLYACSESTVTEPKVDAKKYTLEEILADPNWVEITDTLHYDDIGQLAPPAIGWKEETMKIITNIEDYHKLTVITDTNYFGYKPIELRQIDFSKYSLIGYFIFEKGHKTKKMYFKNLKTKEVFYYFELIRYKPWGTYEGRRSQNWLLVPKIGVDYKLFYDLNIKIEER